MCKYDVFNLDPYASHMKIVRLVGKNKRVLDVGCATGQLAKRFVENGCEVVGIELDEYAAEKAKEFCSRVIVGDVEQMIKIPFTPKYFDVIVFADVLEHLRQPERVLINFKKYLKNSGYIVVSLPNIANWRIRLKLLMGRFDYEESGILDRTHLRFYYEKSARELIVSSGYDIVKFDITPSLPLPPKLGSVNYFISRLRPNLFAFQFIIVGKPR